jgi:hypothetical protein
VNEPKFTNNDEIELDEEVAEIEINMEAAPFLRG